jgi:hypothetical protein
MLEVQKWAKSIQSHKGIWGAVKYWWRSSDVKAGELVGQDKMGNRYYQNISEVVWGMPPDLWR